MAKYIDKDALVAEIERRIKGLEHFNTNDNLRAHGAIAGYYNILSFLRTLETKEVDLDKEKDDYWNKLCDSEFGELLERDAKWFDDIAKHFFELGLSVNNPITAADRGTAEEIIINLKRVESDYRIDLTREIEWLRNKVKKTR